MLHTSGAIRVASSLGFLVLCVPAFACSQAGGMPALAQSYASASEVFVAHVRSVREREAPHSWGMDANGTTLLEASYTLKEVLKGRPPKQGELHDLAYDIGNCSVGLMAGLDYVVLVQPNPEQPSIRYVGMPSGTFPLKGQEAESDLIVLRELAVQELNSGSKQ